MKSFATTSLILFTLVSNTYAFAQATVPSPIPTASAPVTSETIVAVSPTTLIDELANSPEDFPPITREDMLRSLSEGRLISMGETHESGLERDYYAELYNDLSQQPGAKPVECLVENYDVLLAATGDPVRPMFNKVCPSDKVTNNVAGWVYTPLFATYLPQGQVLTHTGFRHIGPIGLIYPNDFDYQAWADIPLHGTLTLQLPDTFPETEEMRSHIVQSLDDLIMSRVSREMLSQISNGTLVEDFVKTEVARIRHWVSSPALKFKSKETARTFEIARMHQSFNYEHMYLSLLNQQAFKAKKLIQLLESPEFVQLLNDVALKDIQNFVFLLIAPKSSFRVGSISFDEPGTIVFYGPDKTQGGKMSAVSISPKTGVQLQHSSN